MSIYDNAGVALIPSGTKAGTLYSVLPANGDGDFTHDRNLTTATRVNKDGFIESVAEDVPRLNYPLIDGVVQDCPHLLLEPQRTNLSEYSESFNNWSGGLVTANQAISPDGNLTADKLTKTSAFSAQSESVTGTSGNNYVFSIFVKADTGTNITLRQASGSNDVRRYFQLSDETSGQAGGNQTGFVSEKIEKYPNGWYRVSTVCTANGTTISTNIYAGRAGSTTYDGNIFIWGSQVEEADYETSYIPNLSTGSTTRSGDDCDSSGTSADFNDSEGVLFAESQGITDATNNNAYISITDGTAGNSLMIVYRSSGDLRIYNSGITGTGDLVYIENLDLTENLKIAVKYGDSTSDYRVYVNGTQKTLRSDFSASALSGLNELKFDYPSGSSGLKFQGKVKQVMTFKTALTDSELETLTSWDSFNAMAKGQLYTIE